VKTGEPLNIITHYLFLIKGEMPSMQNAAFAIIAFNLLTVLLFGLDKWKAVRRNWRISERYLLFFSFIAPVGGLVGIVLFNHKTKKKKFRYLIPLFLIIHISVFVLMFFDGNDLVNSALPHI